MKKDSLAHHKEVAHGETKESMKFKKANSKKDEARIKTSGPGNRAKSTDWSKTK